MRRRAFIAALGGAAAWPLAARGQKPTMPVVSNLQFGQTQGALEGEGKAWLIGLKQTGFENGRNVIVDAVPVPNMEQLPAAVAAQVQRKVAVIYGTLEVALAAKAVTSIIPIVFATADDPVAAGAVNTYSRPGGNVTGVRLRAGDEQTKLLELLHELLPSATKIGVLVFRGGVGIAQDMSLIDAAARSMGVRTVVTLVSDESEFEAAFSEFKRSMVAAVFVNGHRYFSLRRDQIIAAAKLHGLPAVGLRRAFVVAGGIAGYGADVDESLRQAGIYIGRVLRGENPAELPVLQPTKFIFAINLVTARSLGIEVPPSLLARADEVIE
jgi:putative ABC transport system substrate-binding protein